MTTHEKYQIAVTELNEKIAGIRQRAKRCSYLKDRFDKMVACGNQEQAEAYGQRLNWHKPKLLETLEDIEKLETYVNSIKDDIS